MTDDGDWTVHPKWQAWVAENLARSADPAALERTLVDEGVPLEHARACVDDLGAGAAMEEARRLAQRVVALEQIVRLRRDHRGALAAGSTTIERGPLPAASEFLARHWVPGVPAIFTDLVRSWPAFGRWGPRDLVERFGDVVVEACVGRTSIADPDPLWDRLKRDVSIAELVGMLSSAGPANDVYVIAKNAALRRPGLRALLDDIRLPPEIFGHTMQPMRMGLWIGAAGTHTPLHHDGDNSMFCQVVGRKRFRIAPPESLALLDCARGVYSRWDPSDDETDAPEALIELVLEPGDALFLPAGWWHQVDALDLGISVSILEFAWPNDYGWYRPGSALAGRVKP
jgi:hypothetical protein